MSFFGTNIKRIRQVTGMSQKAFADLFKLNRGVIGAYEEGRSEPKIETLLTVAHHFNLDLDKFLTEPLQVDKLKTIPEENIENSSTIELNNKNFTEETKNTINDKLRKKLANIDLIYGIKEKELFLSNYNLGDFLFLMKTDKTENSQPLFYLENNRLLTAQSNSKENTDFYKLTGYISFEQKDILSNMLERIEILEQKLENIK